MTLTSKMRGEDENSDRGGKMNADGGNASGVWVVQDRRRGEDGKAAFDEQRVES